MAENIKKARLSSTLNPQELIGLFYASREEYNKWMDHNNKVAENNLLKPHNITELSRYDQMKLSLEHTRKWQKIMDIDFYAKPTPGLDQMDTAFISGGIGLIMGGPVIHLMGTEDQIKKWGPGVSSGRIMCAYAQTELGHGSDVQSLKTTATFDPKENCFVINTPSIDATKWWPGDLGLNANHVVVYAQVITKGKHVGVLPLFFQVRNMETHQLLPGVQAGDIGPKLGYSWKENGFMSFTNFKVPADSLLGRYTNIDTNGKFTTRGD